MTPDGWPPAQKEPGALARTLGFTAEVLMAAARWTLRREAMGADSALQRQAEGALAEIGRAAVAMRELAQMLEKNPESLLRGWPKQSLQARVAAPG